MNDEVNFVLGLLMIIFVFLFFLSLKLLYSLYQSFRIDKIIDIRNKWLFSRDKRRNKHSFFYMYRPNKNNWFGLRFPRESQFQLEKENDKIDTYSFFEMLRFKIAKFILSNKFAITTKESLRLKDQIIEKQQQIEKIHEEMVINLEERIKILKAKAQPVEQHVENNTNWKLEWTKFGDNT